MIVKKYTAYTTYEAMKQLKKELGSEAIVLSTRKVRQKGLLGFFKKPIVEVTAACKSNNILTSELNNQNIDKVNRELIILKNMMEEIHSSIGENKTTISIKLKKYHAQLIKNGVDHVVATSVLEKLNQQINLHNKDEQTIKNIVKYTISEYIGKPYPINIENKDQKVIFFIGPTGVGKTTTLAKIAAKTVMEKKYKIGLITFDTYRIAAIDQLKTYSDILRLPLEVVYNARDFDKTLIKFKEKDLIFVDTAGENHRKIRKEDELYEMMNSAKNKEIYLVLSGTTNYNVLKAIIEQYSFIEDYKIIFTKMDETEEPGNMLNIKYLTKNPICYITTGQNVPDDIEILDKEQVADRLIGEGMYERSS